MKSLSQFINEKMICELSSELLSRASKAAADKGKTTQAEKFAIAAGKALEKELNGYKPVPGDKSKKNVVAAASKFIGSNPDMKKLAKTDSVAKTQTLHFPVCKQLNDDFDYEFVKYKDVKIPEGKFCIFKDTYRGAYHISTINDMFATVGCFYYDFEDFDASYIIKTFDSLEEAAQYALNDKKHDYVDSEEFIESAANGEEDEEYVLDIWETPAQAFIEMMLNFAEVKNAPKEWEKYM